MNTCIQIHGLFLFFENFISTATFSTERERVLSNIPTLWLCINTLCVTKKSSRGNPLLDVALAIKCALVQAQCTLDDRIAHIAIYYLLAASALIASVSAGTILLRSPTTP